MARRPKSTRELILTGAYRKDRHGNRPAPPAAAVKTQAGRAKAPARKAGRPRGRPRRKAPPIPRWLTSASAKALWRHLAPPLFLAKRAEETDVHALAALCDWYGKYREASAIYERARSPETQRIAGLTASMSWRNCADLMRRFGLTPVDRGALRDTGGKDEPSELEIRFFEGAG